ATEREPLGVQFRTNEPEHPLLGGYRRRRRRIGRGEADADAVRLRNGLEEGRPVEPPATGAAHRPPLAERHRDTSVTGPFILLPFSSRPGKRGTGEKVAAELNWPQVTRHPGQAQRVLELLPLASPALCFSLGLCVQRRAGALD